MFVLSFDCDILRHKKEDYWIKCIDCVDSIYKSCYFISGKIRVYKMKVSKFEMNTIILK